MIPLLLAAPAAPAPENREASPIALVLVLVLLVALVFLIRSMNKHLRKVPESFPRPETPPEPVQQDEQHPAQPPEAGR
jgi:Na+-transporting methylmalonyl-CoA/oxaloacetate decarboxylase gamma subunit